MDWYNMDWDELNEFAEDLDTVIDTRAIEKKYDIEGMDVVELKALAKEVSRRLDEMEEEQAKALEAEYWRNAL